MPTKSTMFHLTLLPEHLPSGGISSIDCDVVDTESPARSAARGSLHFQPNMRHRRKGIMKTPLRCFPLRLPERPQVHGKRHRTRVISPSIRPRVSGWKCPRPLFWTRAGQLSALKSGEQFTTKGVEYSLLLGITHFSEDKIIAVRLTVGFLAALQRLGATTGSIQR